ncbi:cephalosporin esterase precursor [Rhodotorula sp. JG-1b]|nr:cephalosporin esterase precursor [Rhodotorula sp. JG-1b]
MLRSAVRLLTACAASAVLAAPSGHHSLLSKRTSPTEPPPVIDLGYARVQGYLNSTDSQYWWKGIRYASADRFQAPRTPATHTAAVYNASAYGPICFQASEGAVTLQGKPPVANFTIANQSEDCLYLNINAPAGACEGSNLPVLVWIHGGGYAAGSAAQGSDFAEFITNAGGDIVVVTIQYRLGPFGFLAGQETADFGALNAGLLDQQFGFQWVQQHISKFGGDPSHVTIWGESAGAGSIMNHVIAYGGNTQKALGLSDPLFEAAIGSSVFLPSQFKYDSDIVEGIYNSLADTVGCTNSTVGVFRCLQATDAAIISSAGVNLSEAIGYGSWLWDPSIEGKGGFLEDRATILLASGNRNGVRYGATDPTLLGDNTTDAIQLAEQFDAALASYYPYLTSAERQLVAQQYPIEDAPEAGNNTFQRIEQVIGDSTFICPTYWTAEAFGANGWKGTFNYGNAYHADDAAWYDGPIWNGPHSVSALTSFIGGFEGFILAHDPNKNPATKINPYWPTFDTYQQIFFNTTTRSTDSAAAPHIVDSTSLRNFGTSQLAKCDFWRGKISVNAGL